MVTQSLLGEKSPSMWSTSGPLGEVGVGRGGVVVMLDRCWGLEMTKLLEMEEATERLNKVDVAGALQRVVGKWDKRSIELFKGTATRCF